jgi:DnaJ-class molecular chaperone
MIKAVTAAGALASAATAVSHSGISHTIGSHVSSFHVASRSLLLLDTIPRGGASKEDRARDTDSDAAVGDRHNQPQKDIHETPAASPAFKKKKKKPQKSKETASRQTPAATEDVKEPQRRRPSSSTTTKQGHASNDQSSSNQSSNSSSSSGHTMSPHQEKIVNEILKEDDYYKILGTTKEATSTEIQKAYRKRAVLTHPDKMPNGDRRAFDKVSEAYDVLGDETKRKQYHQFGKTASGGGTTSSAEDIFRSFFSSHHHPFFRGATPNQAAPRRNRNVRYQLEVTLEELYNGLTKSVLVSQPSPFGDFGHHQLKRKRVEVHIPVGSFSGQAIVLSGEMDWDPEQTPADIVFILVQRPHSVFTRKGYDLALELSITLEEAIGGVRRTITHLDGRNIVIESAHCGANSNVPLVLQSGAIQVLKGEGMPKRNGKGHGDLYIQYKVEMPAPTATQHYLNPTERDELKHLLSKLQKKQHYQHQHRNHDRSKEDVLGEQPVRILQTATAADFGRNGPDPEDEDHHDTATSMAGDEEDESGPFRAFPFGGNSNSRQFFFSSSGGTDSHPFFRDDWKDDGNGNVQCQQM